MSTVTIQLPEEHALWLKERAVKTGRSQDEIVREQIEEAMAKVPNRAWRKYIGCIDGPEDLSTREGFGPR